MPSHDQSRLGMLLLTALCALTLSVSAVGFASFRVSGSPIAYSIPGPTVDLRGFGKDG